MEECFIRTSVANVWFAPLLRRYLTTESWFSWAAMYSGVNPFCDCAFTEAPRCTSNCTTSSCPAERRYRCHANYSSRRRPFRDARYRRDFASLGRSKCLFKIIRGLVPYAFNERRGPYEKRQDEKEKGRQRDENVCTLTKRSYVQCRVSLFGSGVHNRAAI